MTKARLTPHQTEVYDRLARMSGRRWMSVESIGSRGALKKLVKKGYAEERTDHGPRGGVRLYYRNIL
jgi:DNA-binding PadR family transcriptional regulator